MTAFRMWLFRQISRLGWWVCPEPHKSRLLIKRLQSVAKAKARKYKVNADSTHEWEAATALAAQARRIEEQDGEIEQLVYQIARMDGADATALQQAQEGLAYDAMMADQLCSTLEKREERIKELEADLKGLADLAISFEDERDELRKALEPFVKFTHESYFDGDGAYTLKKVKPIGGGWYGAEDFRRARAALSSNGRGEG